MPAHLIQAMPMLVLGLAGLAWITGRRVRLSRDADEPGRLARRDFAVALALAASWFGGWGLYAAYTWTTQPSLTTLAAVRFYVPALGAIALLGAWLVARVPRPASLAAGVSACVVVVAVRAGRLVLPRDGASAEFRPGAAPRPQRRVRATGCGKRPLPLHECPDLRPRRVAHVDRGEPPGRLLQVGYGGVALAVGVQ